MDSEDIGLEEKCENLMNVVVESRKRFGRMCADYEEKISIVENKLLNLQVETINNFHFKSKTELPDVQVDKMKSDLDNILTEAQEKQNRFDSLRKKLNDVQCIVSQLRSDSVGRKLTVPITAEALLAQAKAKKS